MKRIPQQNHKRMKVQTAVLRAIYAGGVLSVALLAPNALSLLGDNQRGRKQLYGRIHVAQANLKRKGLVHQHAGRLQLTEKGQKSIERILMRDYVIAEQINWDGKWRLLMFDIRENRRKIRLQLRRLLAGAGFLLLQDSVWVHPYPCDEFAQLLRAHLRSGVGELRQATVDALESDHVLRQHFNLL